MTEVSLFGGGVFRRIGEAEGVGVLIVVIGDVRIGYLGPIGNDAPCGKFCGEGTGILSDLAGKCESIVFVVDDDDPVSTDMVVELLSVVGRAASSMISPPLPIRFIEVTYPERNEPTQRLKSPYADY